MTWLLTALQASWSVFSHLTHSGLHLLNILGFLNIPMPSWHVPSLMLFLLLLVIPFSTLSTWNTLTSRLWSKFNFLPSYPDKGIYFIIHIFLSISYSSICFTKVIFFHLLATPTRLKDLQGRIVLFALISAVYCMMPDI